MQKVVHPSNLDIVERLSYFSTFLLILFSFAHVNSKIIMYPFEMFYIILIMFYMLGKRININFYLIWSLSFIIICTLSYFMAPSPSASAIQLINIIKSLLIGNAIVVFINKDNKKIDFIMNSIILSGIYLSLLLIINTPIQSFSTQRIGETIGLNANDLGIKMAISALVTFYLGSQKNKKTLLYSLGFVFITITFFTGSRKALVFILIGLLFLWARNYKKKWVLMMYPIVLLFLFYLWQLLLSNSFLYEVIGWRLEGLINGILGEGYVDNSTRIRLDMIDDGIEMFQKNPILGQGIDSYAVLSPYSTYSHNNYIELLVGVGLVGTVIYYSLYLYIIINLLRKINLSNTIALFFMLVTSLLVIEYGVVTYYIEVFVIILSTSFAACQISSNIFIEKETHHNTKERTQKNVKKII